MDFAKAEDLCIPPGGGVKIANEYFDMVNALDEFRHVRRAMPGVVLQWVEVPPGNGSPQQVAIGAVRVRCVTTPDKPQKVLLNHLGLTLSQRLRYFDEVIQM